jgi:hypothetical protein
MNSTIQSEEFTEEGVTLLTQMIQRKKADIAIPEMAQAAAATDANNLKDDKGKLANNEKTTSTAGSVNGEIIKTSTQAP